MSRSAAGRARVLGEEEQAIEKIDALIQSTRLARPSLELDSQNSGRSRARPCAGEPLEQCTRLAQKIFPPSKRNPPQMKPFSFRLSLSTPLIAALLALLSLSAITSPAEAQASHAHRGLLPAVDADAPSGRPTQRAGTRPPFLTRHHFGLRHWDHGETGLGTRLEQVLGRPAGCGSRGLRPVPRRRICPPGDRLFGRELRRRSADEPGSRAAAAKSSRPSYSSPAGGRCRSIISFAAAA